MDEGGVVSRIGENESRPSSVTTFPGTENTRYAG